MRVPRSWLEEFLGDLGTTAELVTRLDALGLAVEAVHELPAAPAGVVVASVVTVGPLPGSDELRLARVDDGRAQHDVVCGAPNVAVGMRTAFAPPGTTLPAVGIDVGIRDILGQRSYGMLCSPRELALFDSAAGLLHLGDDAPVGAALAELWPAESVLELELTPNRADAFSLLGVARDLAASLGRELLPLPESGLVPPGDASLDDGLRVEVLDEARCPRFTLRRIDGVRIAPSPVWLQRRLAAVGLRPRNNVVDVTNYVTLELGQPSHGYDLRALEGGVMVVRRARTGEGLVTLADDTLELHEEDLVIATPGAGGGRALGLAGVIGGRDDSVRDDTTSLALEVAHFDPVGVRRTARRHRLGTEAQHRFERGVDPNLPSFAARRALALIQAVAGGVVHAGTSEVGGSLERPRIPFRPSRVAHLMALDVPEATQRTFLERLGCRVEGDEGDDRWQVVPPSWRFDLAIEEDLVEEVSRLHGYEHIGATVPAMSYVPVPSDPTHRRLREALVGAGLLETIGYVFTGERELETVRAPAPVVRLAEPQGLERAVLRSALYPGLLAAARANAAAPDLALFEVGRVFLDQEVERLALLVRGGRAGAPWRPGSPIDFFVVKGLLETIAERFRARLETRPAPFPHLHPGVSAEVLWNGRSVGTLGRLHPEVAAALELGDTYLAELDLPLEAAPPSLAAVPRQPYAERDLAIVTPRGVPYAEVARLVTAPAGALLERLVPFDVYEGAQVGEGRRSLALRFRFRHPERALTDDEVEARMKEVMQTLEGAGYAVRT
jgi:phenylalanyl-tRNA synthetase beta chain